MALQQGIIEIIKPSLYRIVLSPDIYSREAVSAAAVRFNELFYVKIEHHDEKSYAVMLQSKNEKQDHIIAAHEFINDVNEEQVRIDLMKKTGSLREIIYRHAFMPIETEEKKQ